MSAIKRLIRSIAPGPYRAALEIVWKRRLRRYESIRLHVDDLIKRNGLSIQSGPFAGMSYVAAARGSVYSAKLIGSYEVELHPFLDRVMSKQYNVVVDIGCAEGYYAVGLATRKPNSVVYAFDSDKSAIALCRELAAKNGVADRVITRGQCSVADLAALPLRNALVFCDCEGFEVELLHPDAVPQLQTADILVELHDSLVPNVTSCIEARFAASHDIEMVQSRPRLASQWPLIASYSPRVQRLMLHEMRFDGIVNWALLTSRHRLRAAEGA
jgi:SAM-dependent methyltransferase